MAKTVVGRAATSALANFGPGTGCTRGSSGTATPSRASAVAAFGPTSDSSAQSEVTSTGSA